MTLAVTLAEAKLHLRVDITDDDSLITSLLNAAHEWVKNFTRRELVTATHIEYRDYFTSMVRLPNPPLISVTSIVYVDTNGDSQTLAADQYDVDTDREPGLITPSYGNDWPVTRDQTQSVTITYSAGYGDADDVPASIKAAIKMMVGNWYENREATIPGVSLTEVPLGVESLLWPYRVLEF